jgi:hypothetical protein
MYTKSSLPSEDLKLLDLQLKGHTEKISELLESSKKTNTFPKIESEFKLFRIALDKASIEIRRIADPGNLKPELRSYRKLYKELYTKYELLGDHVIDIDIKSNDDLMKHGLDVQKDSKDSLTRTIKVINDTKVIGEELLKKLKQNTEQIEQMHDKLESIETTLSRSTKVIKRIARKVASDKYIWVIGILIFIAIITIIVLHYVKH